MSDVDLDILPLTLQTSPQDLRACASAINRRHQFEPNRLRDVTRTEEERLKSKTVQLQKHLSNPRTTANIAKDKNSGDVVGWISWLKPDSSDNKVSDMSDASGQAILVNSILKSADEEDHERDHDAVKLVTAEKKLKEKHIFGAQPFWMLNNLFTSPAVRRSGVGTKLVQHFLSVVKSQDPEAKIGFTSSPMARSLYEKQGFTVAAWFEYTYDDVDEAGRLYKHRTRWPYMSNHFEGHEAEVQKIQHRQAYNGPANLDPENE